MINDLKPRLKRCQLPTSYLQILRTDAGGMINYVIMQTAHDVFCGKKRAKKILLEYCNI